MYRFVVIEKAEHNYAAYSPDLPGCIATGATLEGLKEDNLPVPASQTVAEYRVVQV